MINWADSTENVTAHFNVADACMLHAWNRLATTADGVDFATLENWMNKLEEVRDLLKVPMNVHCSYRSPAYNKQIGAPQNDAHSRCCATDFDCGSSLTIQQIKDILEPELERLNLRMEKGTTTWVHVDGLPVGHARYFIP